MINIPYKHGEMNIDIMQFLLHRNLNDIRYLCKNIIAISPKKLDIKHEICYTIEAIRNAINPSLPIGFGEVEYYPGQVMYLCADTSSLTGDTGFAPEYTFEQGIRETVDWFREEFHV